MKTKPAERADHSSFTSERPKARFCLKSEFAGDDIADQVAEAIMYENER